MKRYLSFLLALVMVFSMGLSAFAKEPVSAQAVWDGQTMTEPQTEGSVVKITSAEELAWAAAQTNAGTEDFTGKTLELAEDIDLGDQAWTPIGTSDHPFKGSLNGNGYTISGLKIVTDSTAAGLFGAVSGSGDEMVQNVTVKGSVNCAATYLGGIAGDVKGTAFENCTADIAVVNGQSNSRAGGLIGRAVSCSITNCTNLGNVYAPDSMQAGGVVAMTGESTVIGCTNQGDITGLSYVGGVVGYIYSDADNNHQEISECVNHGNVTAMGVLSTGSKTNFVYMGGIVGSVYGTGSSEIVVANVYNTGTVKLNARSSYLDAMGGLVGYARGSYTSVSNGYSVGTLDFNGNTVTRYGAVLGLGGGIKAFENLYALEGTSDQLYYAGTADPATGTIAFWTAEQLKSETAVTTLGEKFSMDTTLINEGYPILTKDIPDADYSAVDAAIAKVPEDLSIYIEETAKAVEDALAAVERGKLVTEQDAVDAMAKAIEDAVAALEYKAADYTAVDAALACIPADLSDYSLESVTKLENAVAAVVRGKNITEQDAVDAMAEAVNYAVEHLEILVLPFVDVSEEDWYYNAVKYVYRYGIMTGLGSDPTLFAPLQKLNRAEFTTILYRTEGEPEVDVMVGFPDVAADEWYTTSVSWAAARGIVTGYQATETFGPADPITREQLAVMMYRYAQYKDYDTSARAELDGYADADQVNTYAEEAMQWAVAEGIISGKYEQTQLDPLGTATRAEAATIVMRFMQTY